MHVMGIAYLHHGCTGLDDPGYWLANNWWACHEPDRPLDAETRFEAYCFECGVRWLARSGEA